jgi:hypothetical protein
LRIGVLEDLFHTFWYHLPGHPELVLQPAALVSALLENQATNAL